jgi:hypothetical protein
MIRCIRARLFHWYFLLRRPMTLGVRVLVRDKSGAVLLVRHSYVAGWHLPGGGVERGETAQDAARKELMEEAAIESLGEFELAGFMPIGRHRLAIMWCCSSFVNGVRKNRSSQPARFWRRNFSDWTICHQISRSRQEGGSPNWSTVSPNLSFGRIFTRQPASGDHAAHRSPVPVPRGRCRMGSPFRGSHNSAA